MGGWDDIIKGSNGSDIINGGSGDDYLQGRAGGDYLDGGSGDDQLHGDAGDDYLRGGAGNDLLHGGLGTDTAVFSGSILEYSFSRDGENLYVSHNGGTGIDGNDHLIQMERLIFADAVIDLTQNNAPIAFADFASTDEDVGTYSSGSASVLDNDFDWEGQALTATAGTFVGTYGTLTLNSDGTYTYTPNALAQSLALGQNVTDSFTYTVSDGSLSSTGTLTITVAGRNDAPTANPDTATTGENSSVTVNVLANDTDVDNGAVLTVTAASAPTGQGSASVVANQIVFNPGTDFDHLDDGETANVVVSYTITDEHGATSSSTVTITVTGANDAPVAVDDSASTTEDASVSGNVLANDTDVDVETLTVANPGTYVGAYGTLTLAADGSYTYVPNAAAQGLDDGETVSDTFSYTASDGTASDNATLTVTVNGANDAPVANDDTTSTNEDSAGVGGNVLANDSDVDGETLTVASPGTYVGTYGTLVIAADGSYTYTPGAGAQGLDVGETAHDVFTYTASDGTASDTATLTVTVTGLNDAPVANDDTNATDENSPVSGNVLANDTDVDGETLTVVNSGTFIGAYGTLVLAANGTYTYTPGAGAAALTNGQTANDVFTYIASDGTVSDNATLTITVTGLSGVPNAVDDAASTSEDNSVSGNVLTNDTDPENDALTVSNAGTFVGTYGTLTLNANGSYTYVPNAAQNGLAAGESVQDVFTYTATDGTASDSATLTVTVNGTNDAPTIDAGGTDASGSVTELPDGATGEGTTVHTDSGTIAFDDVDVSDTHSASFTPQGGGYLGTFSLDPVAGHSVGWDFTVSDATLEGLAAGQVVIQTYEVEIDDGNGGTATQTVTITITGAGVGAGPQSVWYIDNSAVGSTNVGTQANPYTSIAAFNAAQGTLGGPQAGHTVYLLTGTGTGVYAETDGINLLNGQILIGQDTAGVRPTIHASAGDGINVAQGNNVSGLDIGNTSGADIADSGGTVGNLTISDVGSSGSGRIIDIDQGGTLNVTLNSAASTGSTGGAIDLNLVGGSFTVTGATTIAGVHSGGGVDVTNSTGLAVDFQGTLTATTGSAVAVNFTGNDAASSLTIGGTGNSIATTSAVAVNIAASSNVSIANATIASASNSAILGTNVNDFSLTDSVVTGGAASNVIGFTNLTGTADLLGNVISGGNNNLSVANSSGSLDLEIADSAGNQAVIGLTSVGGNDGVFVQTGGTASLTLTVDGVDFLGARGDLLQTLAEGNSTQDITITGSNFANAHTNTASGGGGLSIGGGGAGADIDVDYRVENNQFTGADGSAINANFITAAGTIRGLISGNTIGIDDDIGGSEGSSGFGAGILVGLQKLAGAGSATHSVTIDNNEIRDIAGGLGAIELYSSGGGSGNGAVLEATITNNVVEELGPGALAALFGSVGGSAISGDYSQLGIDLRDNDLDSSQSGLAVYLDQTSSDSHFNFPGYAGSSEGEGNGGTASVDLEAFFLANGNNLFGGVVEASFITGATGDPFTLAVWP